MFTKNYNSFSKHENKRYDKFVDNNLIRPMSNRINNNYNNKFHYNSKSESKNNFRINNKKNNNSNNIFRSKINEKRHIINSDNNINKINSNNRYGITYEKNYQENNFLIPLNNHIHFNSIDQINMKEKPFLSGEKNNLFLKSKKNKEPLLSGKKFKIDKEKAILLKKNIESNREKLKFLKKQTNKQIRIILK